MHLISTLSRLPCHVAVSLRPDSVPGLRALLSWPWLKLLAVVLLTAFHYWINARRKDFLRGENQLTSRHFRMLNEVPTVLMIIAVSAVVFKY